METPPNTGPHRFNHMHFRRGEPEDQSKNDPLSKFGSKYHFCKKDGMPAQAERENINKTMNELKKHIAYLENTKWMYENNGDMNPSEHLTHHNL